MGRAIINLAAFAGGIYLLKKFIDIKTKKHKLYRLENKGRLDYIGKTSIGNEKNTEYRHKRNGKKFEKIIFDNKLLTEKEAFVLEKKRIKRLRPKLNIQHNN